MDISDYLVELMVEPIVVLDASLLVSQVSDFMTEIFAMAAKSGTTTETYTDVYEGGYVTTTHTITVNDDGWEYIVVETSHSNGGAVRRTTRTDSDGDGTWDDIDTFVDADGNGYDDDNNDGGFDWPFSSNITAQSEGGRARIVTAYLTHLFLSSDELATLQDNITSLYTGKMKPAVFVTTVKKLFSASAAKLKPVLESDLTPSLTVKKAKVN